MNNNILQSVVVAFVATLGTYLFAITIGWLSFDNLSMIEVLAVFTSYSCTYLCVLQSRWNYPIGFVSILLYCYIFYQANLLASMTLQLYFIPVMIYGWFRWGKDYNTRPVTWAYKDNIYWLSGYLSLSIVSYFLALYLVDVFKGQLATFDTIIFVASILAQFLLDNKKLENWLVWFLVNVVSIYVYYKMGLYMVCLQYVLFLANTIYGFTKWYRS